MKEDGNTNETAIFVMLKKIARNVQKKKIIYYNTVLSPTHWIWCS